MTGKQHPISVIHCDEPKEKYLDKEDFKRKHSINY